MKTLELLSPAKNLSCGKSAIDHGADAVYIGASRFGARAAAGNSTEDIHELCLYAHQYGAKVYVTINTLLYDDELEDAARLCHEVTAAGADAILIQDLRLLKEVQKVGKWNGVFHASTQTDNRTIERVRELRNLGFRRIVLARELSIAEISAIHEAVPEVELEVFVHGALCVSYSGRCYASEVCFGRSANRGECAQFCRLPFTLKDADNNIIETDKYLLSLKDFSQLQNLERLIQAGAISFKIEGRLKDSDYVKNITAAYSKRLDDIISRSNGMYKRASEGTCSYTFTPNIHKSFNRGFTQYFADGRPPLSLGANGHLANIFTPKSIGEEVGHVKEIRGHTFNVSSLSAFSNGDGLCYFNKERILIGFRVNRVEGNRIFPLHMPKDLTPGTTLYRNHDQTFVTLLSKSSAERKISITMNFDVTDTEICLTVNGITTRMPYIYQLAQKSQEENIRRQLTKFGGTIAVCQELTISENAKKAFIPSSQLAELRRQSLQNYIATLTDVTHISTKEAKQSMEQTLTPPTWLMHCRYCIRHELGYCTKFGRKLPWREPLTLHLNDGKEFSLKFNCKDCEMFVCKN